MADARLRLNIAEATLMLARARDFGHSASRDFISPIAFSRHVTPRRRRSKWPSRHGFHTAISVAIQQIFAVIEAQSTLAGADARCRIPQDTLAHCTRAALMSMQAIMTTPTCVFGQRN